MITVFGLFPKALDPGAAILASSIPDLKGRPLFHATAIAVAAHLARRPVTISLQQTQKSQNGRQVLPGSMARTTRSRRPLERGAVIRCWLPTQPAH